MATKARKKNDTSLLTGKVRLSYPHLFQPTSFNGSDAKYSASFIIPKSDTETVTLIKEAIEAAKKLGVEKFGAKFKTATKNPLRDGDTERDDPNYEGCYFINASSKNPVEVVGRYKDPATGKPIPLAETEAYPGCYVQALINFYPFDTAGNRGIAAGLGPIRKVEEGERLGGGYTAGEVFDDDDFEDAEADLNDFI